MRYINDHDLPEGWAWHRVSKQDDETEIEGYVAANGNGEIQGSVEGEFFHPVPVTIEAAEEALSDYSTKINGPEGEEKIEGLAAAATRYLIGRHETVRGKVRNGEITSPEDLQQALFDNMFGGLRKQRTVSESEIEAAGDDPEAFKALLRKKGLLK